MRCYSAVQLCLLVNTSTLKHGSIACWSRAGVLLFVFAHFHKSGNGMYQGLTCTNLGPFASNEAGEIPSRNRARASAHLTFA